MGAESGPFWEATREGRLLVQWCTACDRGIFYPRVSALCAVRRPGGRRPAGAERASTLEWREASGRATVYAAGVEHRPEAAGAVVLRGRALLRRPDRPGGGGAHDDQRRRLPARRRPQRHGRRLSAGSR